MWCDQKTTECCCNLSLANIGVLSNKWLSLQGLGWEVTHHVISGTTDNPDLSAVRPVLHKEASDVDVLGSLAA